jgi:hypothetical protein
LTSGAPHHMERYQRIAHEVFIAIHSTIDSLRPTNGFATRSYTSQHRRGPEHYKLLRHTH